MLFRYETLFLRLEIDCRTSFLLLLVLYLSNISNFGLKIVDLKKLSFHNYKDIQIIVTKNDNALTAYATLFSKTLYHLPLCNSIVFRRIFILFCNISTQNS